jgi:hypothetical protein
MENGNHAERRLVSNLQHLHLPDAQSGRFSVMEGFLLD